MQRSSPKKMQKDLLKKLQKMPRAIKNNRQKQMIKNKKRKTTRRQGIKNKILKMLKHNKKMGKKIVKFLRKSRNRSHLPQIKKSPNL